jgi:integrase
VEPVKVKITTVIDLARGHGAQSARTVLGLSKPEEIRWRERNSVMTACGTTPTPASGAIGSCPRGSALSRRFLLLNTKTEAKAARDRRRIAVREGREEQQQAAQTFEEFVRDVYLPWAKDHKRSYQSDSWRAEVLIKAFGKQPLAEFGVFAIEKFKKERREGKTIRKDKRAPASVNREIELLSKILSLALDHGLIDENPCRRVRKLRLDNRRSRYLSNDEEKKLLAVCHGQRAHLRLLIILALNTGMRRGELLKLEASDLDLARGVVWVRNTKSGRDRAVPINSQARPVFGELLAAAARAKRARLFTMAEIKKAWHSACDEAKIEDLRFHDLRHTFATRLADAGEDAFTIAALLGHSSIVMASRYTHATDQGKREAVEKICHKITTQEGGKVVAIRV